MYEQRHKGAKPNASLDLEIWQKGKAAVPVWAMYATSSNEIRASYLSLEALKDHEWALVVLFRSTD